MGYFNIFYKLTRIIDFLTRKRNRKFVLALCLIGGIVFFSPNVANAQYTNFDSTQLVAIRSAVEGVEINTNGITSYLSTLQSTNSYQLTRLNTISTTLLDNQTYLIYQYQQLTNIHNDLTTVQASLDHIDNDIHDLLTDIDNLLLKIDDLQDTISQILDTLESIDQNITYFGDLNHEDQEEIKELIRQYLYGDKGQFKVVGQNYGGLFFDLNNPIIQRTNNGIIWVFQLKEGYTYDFNFSTTASWNYVLTYYFNENMITPVAGYDTSQNSTLDGFTLPANGNGTLTVLADRDCYIYISYWGNLCTLNSAFSDYNQGQADGIYGGLTNIQETTIIQDTQTRETITQESQTTRNTITDTSIPTNEMTIDTSIVDGVSNEENDNFLISIINKFQNVITPSSSVTTITIPIPKTGKNIVLRSDLLSSHISNTIIGTYITVFWYVVFFIYFFKFAYRVINWVVTGEIIDKPSGFMKYLMEQNAIITASMM